MITMFIEIIDFLYIGIRERCASTRRTIDRRWSGLNHAHSLKYIYKQEKQCSTQLITRVEKERARCCRF